MAIYIDSEAIRWRGRQWCHMVADTLEELHVFAARLGLERRWFQDRCRYPHYDVTMAVRSKALRMGAIDADRTMLIACCKRVRSQALSRHSQSILP
ncbi:DUF4031 domain-containing protein [Pseudoxanthomonas wuyuanensis]